LLLAALSVPLVLGAVVLPAHANASRPVANDVRLVSAAGVTQWLDCRGSGPVTVVVITGLHSTISDWAKVKPSFAKVTRTCFYDRPGLGRSPARANHAQVLNASFYTKELKALLAAAHEPGPYVVVGHSYGGLIARTFAHLNMTSTAGVLLAESVDPGDKTTGKYWTEAGHRIDVHASQTSSGGGPNLGARPLVVLSASRPDENHLGGPTYGQPAWMIKQWIAQQRANARLSTNSIQVVAKSGHVLQQDNPNATFAALRTLVRAITTHTQLNCAYTWVKVSATCRN
jgi:pimeloyl-ACP methyl ester carboxylesterase